MVNMKMLYPEVMDLANAWSKKTVTFFFAKTRCECSWYILARWRVVCAVRRWCTWSVRELYNSASCRSITSTPSLWHSSPRCPGVKLRSLCLDSIQDSSWKLCPSIRWAVVCMSSRRPSLNRPHYGLTHLSVCLSVFRPVLASSSKTKRHRSQNWCELPRWPK